MYNNPCKICGRLGHFENSCNLTVYKPYGLNLFLKSQYSKPVKERKSFNRN